MDWRSGSTALTKAKSAKRWPDGAKLGRGFPQPYLQTKFANLIGKKKKPVEGRPGGGWLDGIKVNDYINFKVTGHRGHGLACRVRRVRSYKSFKAMIADVGVEALLPGMGLSLDEAVALYKSFANQRGTYAALEREYGAVAIDIEPLEPTVTEMAPAAAVLCPSTGWVETAARLLHTAKRASPRSVAMKHIVAEVRAAAEKNAEIFDHESAMELIYLCEDLMVDESRVITLQEMLSGT